MNKDQFIDFLQHPEKLGASEAQMLVKVIEEFPYCQAAYVLHLKALHNEKHISYSSRLKVASAYTSERKMLYRFIMQDELQKKISRAESEIEDKPLTVPSKVESEQKPLVNTEKELTAQEKPEAIAVTEKEENPVSIIPETPEPEKKAEENPVTIPQEQQVQEIIPVQSETSGLTELEQEVLREAVNAVIEQEVFRKTISAASVARPADEIPAEKEEVKAQVEVPEPEEKSAPSENEKLSFSGWLKKLKTDETGFVPKEPTAVPSEKAAESEPAPPLKPIQPSAPSGFDLIDKFIKEEPRIKPKKTEFFSPVNMARMSVVEDDNFVTETLAKVYARQGNHQKAIKAYENLILKYPEKTAYFAALIKELKSKK
jgi:hypothetical protein